MILKWHREVFLSELKLEGEVEFSATQCVLGQLHV